MCKSYMRLYTYEGNTMCKSCMWFYTYKGSTMCKSCGCIPMKVVQCVSHAIVYL